MINAIQLHSELSLIVHIQVGQLGPRSGATSVAIEPLVAQRADHQAKYLSYGGRSGRSTHRKSARECGRKPLHYQPDAQQAGWFTGEVAAARTSSQADAVDPGGQHERDYKFA